MNQKTTHTGRYFRLHPDPGGTIGRFVSKCGERLRILDFGFGIAEVELKLIEFRGSRSPNATRLSSLKRGRTKNATEYLARTPPPNNTQDQLSISSSPSNPIGTV